MNQELPRPGELDWKKSTVLLRHFQKQPKCVKSLSNVVLRKCMSVAMQMRVCFTSMHRALTARQPVINKNILDTFLNQWAYIYIHVHVHELFYVR